VNNNGWIKIYRKVLDSDMYIHLTSKQRDVMLVCLLLANEKWQFLTNESTNKNTLIKIANYKVYQHDTLDSQQTNQQTTNKRLTNKVRKKRNVYNTIYKEKKESFKKISNNKPITNITSGKSVKEHKIITELVFWFSKEILKVEKPDKIWVAREIKNARKLLYEMNLSVDLIKRICVWRVKDNFWRKTFHSLGSIISHLTDWTMESKLKPLTFTEWLENNKSYDFREEQDQTAKAYKFRSAFNQARKDGVVFTSEEIKKNGKAIKILKEV
jgi:hypothetical protein